MLSKGCLHAIRASIYLATLDHTDYVSLTVISEQLGISFHFLTKVLQLLTHKHLMISYRGPKGGVALARSADSITIMEIVTTVDGGVLFNECVLGLAGCGTQAPCPLHDQWGKTRLEIQKMFENTTLEMLAQKIKELQLRISDVSPIKLMDTDSTLKLSANTDQSNTDQSNTDQSNTDQSNTDQL